MQPTPTSSAVATALLDVIPQVMQVLRAEMRRRRGQDLSVVQMRTLAYVNRHPGAPLSAVAEHVGLTLPSMSSQVSGLVARELLARSTAEHDRRYITLTLTDQGRAAHAAARQSTLAHVAARLDSLTAEQQATLIDACALLGQLFSSHPDTVSDPPSDDPATAHRLSS